MLPATLEDVKLLEFDRIIDARGNLSFFENYNPIPFIIQRVQYFYDIPGGKGLEGYAYKTEQEVIVSLSGSFEVVIHNGKYSRTITLNRSYIGLFLPPMVWREFKNFSTNSLALVATDKLYQERSFISSFKEFIRMTNE